MKKSIWIGIAALVASVNGMIFAGDCEEQKEEQQEVTALEQVADNCDICVEKKQEVVAE